MFSTITAHPSIIDAILEDTEQSKVVGILARFKLVKSDIMPEGYGVFTDERGKVVGMITPPEPTTESP